MNSCRNHIQVFEHQSIFLDQEFNGVVFDQKKYEAFENYFGSKGVPYFSLINKGIQFNEYVGVIQVGNTSIEVLPKADKFDTRNFNWQEILIGMLRAVGLFDIHAPSSSSLKLKSNSILDLYFELFINEVEYLLHNGLIKQYQQKSGNVTSLKGSIHFGKHIQENLTHQERFYVKHNSYDFEHLLHFILYKTIQLIKRINTNVKLHSRLGSLMLFFPEMPDIKISKRTFDKLFYTRKNNSYKKAIEIAKLLLLHYHPDVSKGRNNVLALMFDMNLLWEKFVYASLRKFKEDSTTITAQSSKFFWKPKNGNKSKIIPDIVINKDKPDCVVLDTKWKALNGYNPSPDDLRQMYVYHTYYGAKRVALVFPGAETSIFFGSYLDPTTGNELNKECSIISISVEPIIKRWQENIYNDFNRFFNLSLAKQ